MSASTRDSMYVDITSCGGSVYEMSEGYESAEWWCGVVYAMPQMEPMEMWKNSTKKKR